MDVPDIARYIGCADDAFKTQAFVALIQRIDKENSAVGFKRLMEIVFKATQSSSMAISEAACSWIQTAALSPTATATRRDYFKKIDVVFTEILSRANKAAHPLFLTRLCLDLIDSQPSEIADNPDVSTSFYQIFEHLLAKIPSHVLEEVVSSLSYSAPRLLRLIHTEKLPTELRDVFLQQLLSSEPSESSIHVFEMFSNQLSSRHYHLTQRMDVDLQTNKIWFDRLNGLPHQFRIQATDPSKLKLKTAETLLTTSVKGLRVLVESNLVVPGPVMLLPLFSVINSNNQLDKVLAGASRDEKLKQKLVDIFGQCQAPLPVREVDGVVAGVESWFDWLVLDTERVRSLLIHCRESVDAGMKLTLQGLLLIFGVFQTIAGEDSSWLMDEYLSLLAELCSQVFESLVLSFHLCHFSSSQDTGLKRKLVLNLPNLKLNDVLKKQVLKFLYACSESDVWQAAYEAVGRLFEKNDWLFNEAEFQSLIAVRSEDVDPLLIEQKFSLIRLAAATESGEKLVPKMVDLIKKRPDLLKNCVQVVTDLSKNEMIEVQVFKKLLESKVKGPGCEEAWAAYCDFLATSVIDEDDAELAAVCVEELWKLKSRTADTSSKVKSGAYRALAAFSKEHLLETLAGPQDNPDMEPLFLSGAQVFEGVDDSTDDVVLTGFGQFLRKCLEIDVHNIPRNYFVSSERALKRRDGPTGSNNYGQLPDRSVLKHAFNVALTTKNLRLKKAILDAFVGLKRVDSDGTTFRLPAVDWGQAPFCDAEELNLVLFVIALEQIDVSLIEKKLSSRGVTRDEVMSVEGQVADALKAMVDAIQDNVLEKVVEFLLEVVVDVISGVREGGRSPGKKLVEALNHVAATNANIQKVLATRLKDCDLAAPLFKAFCQVPNICSQMSGARIELWKELNKGDRIEFGPLIHKYTDSRDLLMLLAWTRHQLAEETKSKILKKLVQISTTDKASGDVIFELLVGVVSNLDEYLVYPVELNVGGLGEEKALLVRAFPERLLRISKEHLESVAKTLVNVLSDSGAAAGVKLKQEEHLDVAKQCLRICVNLLPRFIQKIDQKLLNLLTQ